jgi:hypothetical protein
MSTNAPTVHFAEIGDILESEEAPQSDAWQARPISKFARFHCLHFSCSPCCKVFSGSCSICCTVTRFTDFKILLAFQVHQGRLGCSRYCRESNEIAVMARDMDEAPPSYFLAASCMIFLP